MPRWKLRIGHWLCIFVPTRTSQPQIVFGNCTQHGATYHPNKESWAPSGSQYYLDYHRITVCIRCIARVRLTSGFSWWFRDWPTHIAHWLWRRWPTPVSDVLNSIHTDLASSKCAWSFLLLWTSHSTQINHGSSFPQSGAGRWKYLIQLWLIVARVWDQSYTCIVSVYR